MIPAADLFRGMHVTTAQAPERGRALARLQADLESLERLLAPSNVSAAERLDESLGVELARKLRFGLQGRGRRTAAVAA